MIYVSHIVNFAILYPIEIYEGSTVVEIDIGSIQKDEIIKAMKILKSGKSGGIDGITHDNS
jgi:hypothetical protein